MDISAVEYDLTIKLREQLDDSGFSCVPVYKETMDKIEGLLYITPAPFWTKANRLNGKADPAGLFVPETKKLDSLLKDFQNKRAHGRGGKRIWGHFRAHHPEDLIEEIIGDINDEFDEEEQSFVKINENTFVFEGKTPP